MKVRLSIGQKPWSGHLNIDPAPQPDGDKGFDVVPLDPRNIDSVVNDAECNELIIEDIVDYVPRNELKPVLQGWVKKLRHNGILHLCGTDLFEISRLYLTGRVNNDEINLVLYGGRQHSWDQKSGLTNIREVVDLLTQLGLQVTLQKLDGIKLVIEAVRP